MVMELGMKAMGGMKGLKPVRVMGVVIILISVVFIALIADLMVRVNVSCLLGGGNSIIRCGMRRFSTDIVFGLALVTLFTFLAISAVYLMKTNPMI